MYWNKIKLNKHWKQQKQKQKRQHQRYYSSILNSEIQNEYKICRGYSFMSWRISALVILDINMNIICRITELDIVHVSVILLSIV